MLSRLEYNQFQVKYILFWNFQTPSSVYNVKILRSHWWLASMFRQIGGRSCRKRSLKFPFKLEAVRATKGIPNFLSNWRSFVPQKGPQISVKLEVVRAPKRSLKLEIFCAAKGFSNWRSTVPLL